MDEEFFISGEDADDFAQGDEIRLLGLGNIIIEKEGVELQARFTGEEELKNIPKVQWVPKKTAHKIKMIIPKILFNENEEFNEESLEEFDVYVEPYYLQINEGEEVQFIRFGYCRKESQTQAIFTHK